jgi:uncharacterized protein
MPIISESSFPGASSWQYNGHLQTLVPGIFRRVSGVTYTRERIFTPDDDFLDLDWIMNGHDRLVVLTHGLEGNTEKQYMRGAAKIFRNNGWDVLAWNCRSCSGEMNRAFRLYHHGDTLDIDLVLEHALATGRYKKVSLLGFSMGANITMNYLGTKSAAVPKEVCAAVVFSAPCDLEPASDALDHWDNTLYRVRFTRALVKKIKIKADLFPGRLDLSKLAKVQRWRDFDEWFSAPICGYRDANEFYQNSSAKFFISGIKVPTLLINALNDPILTPECMPYDLAREHAFFYLETPSAGGHCGFMGKDDQEVAWSEKRALAFISSSAHG